VTEEMIMPPVHPGEILLEELDRPRPAPHHRGYRATAVPVLRHLRAVLAEHAGPLRPRDREGQAGRRTRQHPPAQCSELTALSQTHARKCRITETGTSFRASNRHALKWREPVAAHQIRYLITRHVGEPAPVRIEIKLCPVCS
jgi:hypothetical protein